MIFRILVTLFLLLQLAGYAQSKASEIIISNEIKLIPLSPKAYVHVSVAEIQGFGRVSSNGLVLVNDGQAFLFDTPVTNEQTAALVSFLADSLNAKVVGFIPNHWHDDCMGGLEYLNSLGVKTYANQMTIDIARKKGLPLPKQGFRDSLSLKLKDTEIQCFYLGGGHATDNIVAWIPSEKILFGGCMVKNLGSQGLGNLSDADLKSWPTTLQKVMAKFPQVKTVIPGHGEAGGKELLVHTSKLLHDLPVN